MQNLKSNIDKLDIDKLKNIPSNLSNSKSKLEKWDVDKLVLFPVDLSKLSDVVENDVDKKDACNVKIKNIDDKIPDIINLATNTTLNTKINKVKNKIHSITNFTAVVTTVTTSLNAKTNLVSDDSPTGQNSDNFSGNLQHSKVML